MVWCVVTCGEDEFGVVVMCCTLWCGVMVICAKVVIMRMCAMVVVMWCGVIDGICSIV